MLIAEAKATRRPTESASARLVELRAYLEAGAGRLAAGDPLAGRALAYVWRRFGIDELSARELALGLDNGAPDRERPSFLGPVFVGRPRLIVPFMVGGLLTGLQGRALDNDREPRWACPTNIDGSEWGKIATFALERPGPVLLCESPGSALAGVGVGLASVALRGASLAAGEKAGRRHLAPVLGLLEGRWVLVPGDADLAGRRFAESASQVLADLGIESALLPLWQSRDDDGYDLADLLAGARSEQERAGARRLLAQMAQPVAPRVASRPSLNGKPDASVELAAEDQPLWEPPIPLLGPPPPPFPLEVLPTGLGEWVGALALSYQVPPDLPAMLALGSISAAVAGSVRVRVRADWREELCAYVAVVLGSGERKSPIVREAAAPLEQWERDALEREREQLLADEETLRITEKRLTHAREAAAKVDDDAERAAAEAEVRELAVQLDRLERPVFPRLLADDATPEALVSLMAGQGGKIAVLSAEGGLFDILAGRYSDGPNLDAVLKAYYCESIRVDRKGRAPEHIPRPALTLALAVQPAVLERLAGRPELRGRGLLARFFYSVPRSALGRRELEPPPVPERVRYGYEARLSELLDGAAQSAKSAKSTPDRDLADLADLAAGSDCPELALGDEAKAVLRSFRAALEPRLDQESGDLAGAADWAGKLAGGCVRIAGLLHLYQHGWSTALGRPIEGQTMTSAIAIAEYLIAHALVALGLTGPRGSDAAPARALLRWIKRDGKSVFKASDVLDALSRTAFPDMTFVEAALRTLEQFNHVRRLPEARRIGPGRPGSPTYEVNPLVLADQGREESR